MTAILLAGKWSHTRLPQARRPRGNQRRRLRLPQARRPRLTPAQSPLLDSALQRPLLDSALKCPRLQIILKYPLASTFPKDFFWGDSMAPAVEAGVGAGDAASEAVPPWPPKSLDPPWPPKSPNPPWPPKSLDPPWPSKLPAPPWPPGSPDLPWPPEFFREGGVIVSLLSLCLLFPSLLCPYLVSSCSSSRFGY